MPMYAIAGAIGVIGLSLGLLLRASRALERERLAFATFKARFPPTLLDLDAHVQDLRAEKLSLDSGIALAKATAEQAKETEMARFEELSQSLDREHKTKSADWDQKFTEAMKELERLHGEVEGLSDIAEMESFGLYKPRYEFARAEEFEAKLEQVRDAEKLLLKKKSAAVCATTWQVGGNAAEGRRMVERQIKLMLRAFNGESDAATASVSWKNVMALRERIRKSFEAINKLGATIQCEITMEYLQLRLDELDLAYEYAEKLHAEKEEQRELREQMREEEKASKEIEREKEEAEREARHYQKALDQARAEVQQSGEWDRALVDAKIAKLEGLLAKAKDRKQRAISQAELTKLGYVYILSNEGSFGPNVFKVGMTRRLDPQDRVDELGSASVPFRFDVHAIIRSNDAPALELKLHEALEPHRINLVNHRKEYFRVPLEKIVDLVSQHHGHSEFIQLSDAAEYRKSLAIRAEREAMVAGKAAQAAAMTRAEEMRARYEELKKATA